MEGWNDPPKHVGPPTGNLKINLNKRVAFPLAAGGPTQTATGTTCPLLLPPKPPTALGGETNLESQSEPCNFEDIDSMKGRVMETLSQGVEELSSSVRTSVKTKLKTLEDDWSQCDVEMKKLLVQLTEYLDKKDSKSASTIQRKIVMKGCSKQWLIAVRQIVSNLEAKQAAESESTELPSSDDPIPLANPLDPPMASSP